MADYVITTDSNSDVLPEFIRENDLTIIPQYYSFGDTVYGDELNMPPHEFYETMRNGELPKSQANNPAVIRERFEKILKEGKDIRLPERVSWRGCIRLPGGGALESREEHG